MMDNNQVMQSPIAKNAIEMAKNGNMKGVEKLARNLCKEKGIEAEDAAYAVARLIELGFLNDETYGRQVVEQCRAKGWGRIRITQELKKKQLEPELVERLLEDFEPDTEKMRRLIDARLKGDPAPDRAAVKKAADSLARRGFTWAQIRQALSDYTEQLEEMEP